MPEFRIRGRRPHGRRTVVLIEADTPAEALEKAAGSGLQSLELSSGAIEADVTAAMRVRPGTVRLSAKDRAAFKEHGAFLFYAREFGLTWFLAAAVIAFRFWRTGRLGTLDALLAGLAVLGLYFPLKARRASAPYRALVRARSHGNWEEVLRRVEALADSPVPLYELTYSRALALIGLGRDAEAREAEQRLAGDTTIKPWHRELTLAGLDSRRGAVDAARAHHRRAVELAPDLAETHLSLGEFLAGPYVSDPRAAEASLTAALGLPVSRSICWALRRLEGQIALAHGDLVGARRLLEESRALFLTKRDVGSRKVVCAWGDCYLALVAARLGESDRARRLFASAEPWMRVHKIGHFLDRVRGVLAGAPVESVFARR